MLNKFVPLIVALSAFTAWEAVLTNPQRFWGGLGVLVVVFVTGFFKWQGFRLRSREIWLLAVPPLFLLVLSGVFLLFLNIALVAHALTVGMAVVVYVYLNHAYKFIFEITRYKPLSLERFSSYVGLINVTFAGICAYGFINFLNAPLWQVALGMASIIFVMTYEFLWVNKIDEQHNIFASLLITILIVEFFWAISLFPIIHFVSGLALAIIYYVIVNLTLLHFLDKLEKRIVMTYVSIGTVCVLAILLSAKWL